MKQVLDIFRKDVRHLWPSILVVQILVIAHAVLDVLTQAIHIAALDPLSGAATLLSMLLTLAIAFLVAQTIFQERLPGDKQFWLTRPYYWPSLLAAKLLFALVFVNIPLFLSDCYILGVQGLAVFSVLPKLLLRQLFIAALFILPSFMFASITGGLAQFVLAWFILIAVFAAQLVIGVASVRNSPGVGAVAGSENVGFVTSGNTGLIFLLVLFVGVIVWQYATRRTAVARAVLLALLALSIISEWWPRSKPQPLPALPQQPNGFAIRISYDPDRALSGEDLSPAGRSQILFPLKVDGLPPQTLLRGFGFLSVTKAPLRQWSGAVERSASGYWLRLFLTPGLLEQLQQKKVGLQTEDLRFELLTDQPDATIDVKKPIFFAPHLGLCRVLSNEMGEWIVCRRGLEDDVETTATIRYTGNTVTTTSIPAEALPPGLSPTTQTIAAIPPDYKAPTQITTIPRRKLAEFQRSIDLSGVPFGKYVVP